MMNPTLSKKLLHNALIGMIFILVLAAITAACLIQFGGGFNTYVTATVVSDRSGLLLDPGTKVKVQGVQVGIVDGATVRDGKAAIKINLYPGDAKNIPSDVTAQIKATTAFGSKYIELVNSDSGVARSIRSGSVIRATNVTTEVNTVFENLSNLMSSVDAGKLNATLGAVAVGLRGRGQQLGTTLTTANSYLGEINPRMQTVGRDWRLASSVLGTYADVSPEIMSILSNGTTTSDTISAKGKEYTQLLLSAIGLGNQGAATLGPAANDFVKQNSLLVPTTTLLKKYSPEVTCTLQSAVRVYDGASNWTGGTNGYSADVDASILLGDEQYFYNKNDLPRVAAQGGPGGKPGCYPEITRDMYPAPYLVMNFGADQSKATKIKPTSVPFVQYLFGNVFGGQGK